MVYMEDLLYCQPLSPVVRQYFSESLLSLFYTALRWSYDERNSFGAPEHVRTDPAPAQRTNTVHLFIINASLEGVCPVFFTHSQYLLKE
jgi:hypothetical protein